MAEGKTEYTHFVTIAQHQFMSSLYFTSEEKARAAYKKLVAAVAEYKEYGNGGNSTVEVESEAGNSTYIVRFVQNVEFCTAEGMLPQQEWNARERGKREALSDLAFRAEKLKHEPEKNQTESPST